VVNYAFDYDDKANVDAYHDKANRHDYPTNYCECCPHIISLTQAVVLSSVRFPPSTPVQSQRIGQPFH
jgi:hypothetical protein